MKRFQKWLETMFDDELHDEHITEFRHEVVSTARAYARKYTARADYRVRVAQEDRDAMSEVLSQMIKNHAEQLASLTVEVETLKLRIRTSKAEL